MRELTDSIIITLSKQTIKERRGGLRQILKEWSASDGDNKVWGYMMRNVPTQEIINVYWVIAGRIRWKCKIAEVRQNRWKRLGRGGKVEEYSTYCVFLFDFEPIPRIDQMEMKGFQGFRYFKVN